MPAGGSTKSAHPVAMALCGMPACCADFSSWAKMIPPSSLTARMPRAPSEPLPDRITAMARDFFRRQRAQENVNGVVQSGALHTRTQPQSALGYRNGLIRRKDKHDVRFQNVPFGCLSYPHPRFGGENLGQGARMAWIKVLNQHVGKADFGRQVYS